MNILTVHKNYFKIALQTGGYVLALMLILTFYAVFHEANQEVNQSESAINTSSQPQTDYNIIAPMHMFGLSDESRLRKISNSNIKLVGIIYQENASKAIMLINSKEQIYNIGDKVENTYTIQKIEPSRVIVATQDGFEEIGLFEPLNESGIVKNDAATAANPEFDYTTNTEQTPQISSQEQEQAQIQAQEQEQAQTQVTTPNNTSAEQAFKALGMKRGFRGNYGGF